MSQRVNHAKVNSQKRIASESATCDRYPARTTLSHCGGDFRGSKTWLPIRFGEHEGKTLPQIVFEDPRYVVWLYEHNILLSKLYENADRFNIAHQLQVIRNRMTKIKPPAGCECAIVVDGAGAFHEFIALKKGQLPKNRLTKGLKIKKRLDLLDIGIPAQFKDPKRGFERMQQHLMGEYLGCLDSEADAKACEAFVDDDAKFNLKGIRAHKWLEPGPGDRAALEEAYKRLAILRSIKPTQIIRHWNVPG